MDRASISSSYTGHYCNTTRIDRSNGEGRMIESMASSAAPAVVSDENVYRRRWTNNTANNNEEVMFIASSDSGQAFGPMLILSTQVTIGDGREGGEEQHV
jgi:hypothetical protein